MSKLIQKSIIALIGLTMLFSGHAMAEEQLLPFGLRTDMSWNDGVALLGESAELQPWSDTGDDAEVGSIYCSDLSFEGLEVDVLEANFSRNNSKRESRLSNVLLQLKLGDNVIEDFRKAFSALTALYGDADENPFNADGIEQYVEFGTLDAFWTRDTLRINLSMNRAYNDFVAVNYIPRINYDADDLK